MPEHSIITPEVITRFDSVLARGLCIGLGTSDGQMCIEAAVCYALNLPHGDNPSCVTPAIRIYKIHLNDTNWSNPNARAEGLRDLGIAQMGSNGVVSNSQFVVKLTKAIIRDLLPTLFREIFPDNERCLRAAKDCEFRGAYRS